MQPTSLVELEIGFVQRQAANGAGVDEIDQCLLEVIDTGQGLVGGDDYVWQHTALSDTSRT